MILHRLRLTNFRGVADREIAFPDHGVVVVCGPNEVGKTSMLEALDLLLTLPGPFQPPRRQGGQTCQCRRRCRG